MRVNRSLGVLVTVAFVVMVTGLSSVLAYSRPGRTEAVAVGRDGAASNGMSDHPVLSADGRFVAFRSWASNLVSGDTNGFPDVFVRDRESGVIERVSVASDGTAGNSQSDLPAVSRDGRYVVFKSWASTLVPDDTNEAPDTFVHDRATGLTELVSVSSDGSQGNNQFGSFSCSISDDGRYVAFSSWASNLVPDDTNGTGDIFVHDRDTGVTERVSVAGDGTPSNGNSGVPSISADGRYVTFHSLGSNLVPGDTNLANDVFVHDRVTRTTERVSVASNGAEAVGNSSVSSSAISSDGRVVTFTSWASNLVPRDGNESGDAFVHDRETGTTERVSVGSDGAEANDDAYTPTSISPDGRYVAFNSVASNLVSDDTNEIGDAFVYDRETAVTERVSLASDGSQGLSQSAAHSLSDDGRHVAQSSFAFATLSGGVFIRNRGPGVGIGEVTASAQGDATSTSGWATFSGTEAASVFESGDDGAPGAKAIGAELTGIRLMARPEQEDLLIRWVLSELPEPGNRLPGVVYGLEFVLGGQRYEARAVRVATSGSSPGSPAFALYRCDAVCEEVAGLSGGLGTTGDEVRVALPLETLGADFGNTLTGLRAYTALGDAATGQVAAVDEVALPDASLPEPRVTLGIAPAGAPEDDVAFDTGAELAAGDFSGSLDVSSLASGDYEVWARACLGDLCGAHSVPVTLGDGSDPQPTGSPTPDPSEDPVPDTTFVAFTARSATSGQHSDEAFLEARLTDSAGVPLADAELVFELAGAEPPRSFTATTDDKGVAAVTPTLTEKPGPHQVTVRYAGGGSHEGSATIVAFVVDKEDSVLELTVAGRGNNRTLTARLADEDTPAHGIADRAVDFYADGELIGTATTNANGVATLKAPPRYRGGKHDFEARFEGDDYFIGSSDRNQT